LRDDMRRAPRRTNATHSFGMASPIRTHPQPPVRRASPSVSSTSSASSSSVPAAACAVDMAGAGRASAPAATRALARAPRSCGPELGAPRKVESGGLAATAAEECAAAAAAAAAPATDSAVRTRERGSSCRAPLAPVVVVGTPPVGAGAAAARAADSARASVATADGSECRQGRGDLS